MALKVCRFVVCFRGKPVRPLNVCAIKPQDNVKELKQKLEDSNKLLASNQQGAPILTVVSALLAFADSGDLCSDRMAEQGDQ